MSVTLLLTRSVRSRATSPVGRRPTVLVVASSLLAVVLALVVLSSCTGQQRVPSDYGDTTSKNFQKGCVQTSTRERIEDPTSVCRCAYNTLTKEVPFKEFKKVYSDLQDEPGPLPANFVAIMNRCVDDPSGESATTTTAEGSPTSTATTGG